MQAETRNRIFDKCFESLRIPAIHLGNFRQGAWLGFSPGRPRLSRAHGPALFHKFALPGMQFLRDRLNCDAVHAHFERLVGPQSRGFNSRGVHSTAPSSHTRRSCLSRKILLRGGHFVACSPFRPRPCCFGVSRHLLPLRLWCFMSASWQQSPRSIPQAVGELEICKKIT